MEDISTSNPDAGTGPATAPPAAPAPPAGAVRRSRSDRMVAGVCGGFAPVLGVDSIILRLALVVATLLGFGLGVIIYLVCWILMPEE